MYIYFLILPKNMSYIRVTQTKIFVHLNLRDDGFFKSPNFPLRGQRTAFSKRENGSHYFYFSSGSSVFRVRSTTQKNNLKKGIV